MKTLKYLTICLVLCGLFTSNVFGQCFNGVNISITGEVGFPGSGIPATEAFIGDTIAYSVTVGIGPSNCELIDLSGTLTLPNGVPFDLGIIPNLTPPSEEPLGFIASYVIDAADLGQLTDNPSGADPTQPDEVRAKVTIVGTAIVDPATTPPTTDGAGGIAVRTTKAIPVNPIIQVTKEACPSSKVGDEIIYDITITNVGDVDLDFTSVTDTLLDDGVVEAALLGAGCATLTAGGGSCTFQVPYTVLPGDDAGPGTILVNVIEVTYTHTATGESDVDDDDAVVELLHPSFTLDVECLEIIGGDALFEVTFCNTGDVDLMVDAQDGQLPPFALPVGPCLPPFIVQTPVDQAVCGASSASYTVSALAAITMPPGTPAECQLGNIITPVPAEDTATCTVNTNPGFTADKVCLDTLPGDVADGFADFQIDFTNTGDVPLLIEIDDPAASYFSTEGPFAPGASGFVIVSIPTGIQTCPADDILNAATVTGICVIDGTRLDPQQVNATCPGACADFDVEKTCVTTSGLMDGETAEYDIVITNTGDVPLNLIINDPSAEPPLVDELATIGPGEKYETIVSRTVVCVGPGQFVIENTVSVVAIAPDGSQIGPKSSTAECPYECGGNEGCTPGFWKNHTKCWCLDYAPDMPVIEVFTALDPNYLTLSDRKGDFNTDTLLDALKYRGGPELLGSVRNMLRHATAALLNGCSGDVAYPASDALVIEVVNLALDSNDPAAVQELHGVLAGWNEDSPCPIDAHCIRHEPVVTP